MQFFDKSFVKSPHSYIYQSLLAAATVLVILTFVEVLTHAVIIVALGSSTFTVFAMPDNISAQPRRLIGGHIVGILCGVVSYYALMRGAFGRTIRWHRLCLLDRGGAGRGTIDIHHDSNQYRTPSSLGHGPWYCCS